MYNTPRTTEEMIAMLKTAPEYIAAVVAGLEPDLLLAPPAPGEWSARDLLGHLRACSDMWGGYILRILNEDFTAMANARWRLAIGGSAWTGSFTTANGTPNLPAANGARKTRISSAN